MHRRPRKTFSLGLGLVCLLGCNRIQALPDGNDRLAVAGTLCTKAAPTGQSRTLVTQSVIVTNQTARVASFDGVVDVYADSDGDGLIDAVEAQLGTRSDLADSDGDGLDDFAEITLAGSFNPLVAKSPPYNATALADSDGDGLPTVVESALGTSPYNADSDGDGIADGAEWHAGTLPTTSDSQADPDRDGRSNAQEFAQGTQPAGAEDANFVAANAITLAPLGTAQPQADGSICYDFSATGLTLRETASATGSDATQHPDGYNRIVLQYLERAGSSSALGRRGETGIIFRPLSGVRDPPTFELTLLPAQMDDAP